MLESCLHLQYLADHVDLRHPTRHHHHRTSHRKSHSRKRMHRMKIHCHQLPAKKVKVTLFKSEARYSGIISGKENLVYLGFSKILQTGWFGATSTPGSPWTSSCTRSLRTASLSTQPTTRQRVGNPAVPRLVVIANQEHGVCSPTFC